MNALQCRLARVALGLKFLEAAKLCGVSHETIRRIELGDPVLKEATVQKVRAAFEKAGIDFIDENGGGVKLRKARRAATKPKRGE
jgi:transcriptional regulator with XRE-family HTH domain